MCMAICATATSCNDNDDVVDNSRAGLYEGTLTQRYRDAHTGEIKESTTPVLVQATKNGSENLVCATYNTSRYHDRWYTGRQPLDTRTLTFVPTTTVLASTDGAHLRENRLVYRYALPSGTLDKNGNELLTLSFSGLKVVRDDISMEVEPLGEYEGHMYVSTIECPDEQSFNEAKNLSELDITGITSENIEIRVFRKATESKLSIEGWNNGLMVYSQVATSYQTDNFDCLVCGNAIFDMEQNIEIFKVTSQKYDEDSANYGQVTLTKITAAKKTAYAEPD